MEINLNSDKPNPSGIFKMQSRSLPEYMFEYHPESRKAYRIDVTKVNTGANGTKSHEGVIMHSPSCPVKDILEFESIVRAFVAGVQEGMSRPRTIIGTANADF
jgi:hypothetical protein